MSAPRRAALDAPDGVVDDVVAPRHGAVEFAPDDATARPRGFNWTRSVVAPVAVVSAFAMLIAGAVLVPKPTTTDAVPQVAYSTVLRANTIGRSQQRPALAPLSPPTPSRVSVPSAPPSAASAPASSASPTAAPSTTASASRTAAPAFDPRALAASRGSAWVSATVNARTAPEKDAESMRVLADGTKVTLTALSREGWQQINLNGRAAWVRETYITSTAPTPPTAKPAPKATAKAPTKATEPSESSDGSGSTSSGGFSTAACEHSASIESGLTAQTRKVFRAVCGQFPSITSYGGRRASGGYHGSGRAIDVMVSGDFGWTVAKWVRANASKLGVIEVIYAQKIWTSERSGDGWRPMSDRGNATANHYDHVHISVGR